MTVSLFWIQQQLADVPAVDDWLSAEERGVLERLTVPKRREEWRLGRWTAKRGLLLAGAREYRQLRLPAINGVRVRWPRVEIVAAPDGAPEAMLDGRPLPVGLSLTHRAGVAGCLVVPPQVQAGCDIELIEERSDAFVEDYFTAGERSALTLTPPAGRPLVATLVWSAKESALKAIRCGLRADTREADVRLLPWLTRAGWSALAVHRNERPRLLSGWWRANDRFVTTVVSFPPTDPPKAVLQEEADTAEASR